MAVGFGEAWQPLAERRFRLLWLGRVSSQAGDAIVPLALTFAVLSIHRSGAALGIVLGSLMVTRVVFTLAGGVVADRISRRTVMVASDFVRGVVQTFIAAMLLTHHMTLPIFVAAEAVYGTASAFFNPAADGLLPQTISSGNLQRANALLGLSRNTVNVFGPLVSSVVVSFAGPGYIFAADAVSFAASLYFVARLDVDAPARAPSTGFATQLREGFSEVASRDWVRAPLVAFAISNIALASFLVLGPLTFVTHFQHAKLDWGITSACGSISAIIGAIASVRLKPTHPLALGLVISTLIAIPIAALAGPLPMPVIAIGWGLGMGSVALMNIWWETALEQRIPEHVLSRVRSYDLLVSFVFMPIGLIAFGPIGDHVGYAWTLLVVAGAVVITNVTAAFAPGVRSLEAAPTAAAAPA